MVHFFGGARERPRSRDTVHATPGSLRERYLDPVYAFVARRVRERGDAEDITAETFAAAYAAIGRCPAPGPDGADPARAWLLAIARRKVADLARRQMRRPEAPLSDALVETWQGGRSAEAEALDSEAAAAIRRVVESLKPEQREVLLLKYADGLSLDEIGQLLGKSPAAVSSLLQRARAAAYQRGSAYFVEGESR